MKKRPLIVGAIALAFLTGTILELNPYSTNGAASIDETFDLRCHRIDDQITCGGTIDTTSTSTTVAPSTSSSTSTSTSTSTSSTSTSTTVASTTTTTVPPTGTYTVGAGDTQTRLAAPTAPATMTVAQLAAAGGNITSPTVIRGGSYSGKVTISGNDVVITGVTFTSNQSDAIRVTGLSTRVRLYKNTFQNTGSNAGCGSFGVIKVDPHPSVTDNAATQRVPIVRSLTVDENTFNQPRNCVMWINHGNQRIRFSHNTITGPAFTPTGDTENEVFKPGWNDGENDCANSVFAFNTITNWNGLPYTTGFKQSCWQIVGNSLTRRMEIRSANNVQIVGNVTADGDLHGGGIGHTVSKNFIRTVVDKDSYGPLDMYSSNGGGFYRVWKNGTFTGNTIINSTPGDGYGVVLFHSQMGGVTERPNGNVFTDNLFVTTIAAGKNGSGVILRSNNDSWTTAQVAAQNTWVNNRYASTISPVQGVPPGATQVAVPASTVPTTVVLTAGELPGTV